MPRYLSSAVAICAGPYALSAAACHREAVEAVHMGSYNSKESRPSAAMPPCSAGQGAASSSQSSCPIPDEYRNQPVYNVYNQRIDAAASAQPSTSYAPHIEVLDPKNNMPLQANQQPFPGQRKLLDTSRVESTIPKGGTNTTWTYPSPQMFFNALMRKGKGEDVTEDVMDAVVHTHNSMNEMTWQKVQQWEKLHPQRDGETGARLLRFLGRPHDLSPLARLRSIAGGPLPFDRHDWYIDRNGREVRYVIDFYFDDAQAGKAEAFDLEVRPALDSLESALDRLKMSVYIQFAKWGVPCPISGDAGHVIPRSEA